MPTPDREPFRIYKPTLDIDSQTLSDPREPQAVQVESIRELAQMYATDLGVSGLEVPLNDFIEKVEPISYLNGLALVSRAGRHLTIYGLADMSHVDQTCREALDALENIYDELTESLEGVTDEVGTGLAFHHTEQGMTDSLVESLTDKWRHDPDASLIAFIITRR